jgi:hypothetical protein
VIDAGWHIADSVVVVLGLDSSPGEEKYDALSLSDGHSGKRDRLSLSDRRSADSGDCRRAGVARAGDSQPDNEPGARRAPEAHAPRFPDSLAHGRVPRKLNSLSVLVWLPLRRSCEKILSEISISI